MGLTSTNVPASAHGHFFRPAYFTGSGVLANFSSHSSVSDLGRSMGMPRARDHTPCASTPSARETLPSLRTRRGREGGELG